jgi:hypothetical protein
MAHGQRPVHPGNFVTPDKYDVLFGQDYQFSSPPASNVSGPGSNYGPGGNYNADFERHFGPYFAALKSGGMAAIGGRPGALSPGAKVAAWDAMQIYGPEYLAKQAEWKAGVDAYEGWVEDPAPAPAPVPPPEIAPPLPPGPIEPPPPPLPPFEGPPSAPAPPAPGVAPGEPGPPELPVPPPSGLPGEPVPQPTPQPLPSPGPPTEAAQTGATQAGDIRTGVRRTRLKRFPSALESAGQYIGLTGGGLLERPSLVGRVRSALGLG